MIGCCKKRQPFPGCGRRRKLFEVKAGRVVLARLCSACLGRLNGELEENNQRRARAIADRVGGVRDGAVGTGGRVATGHPRRAQSRESRSRGAVADPMEQPRGADHDRPGGAPVAGPPSAGRAGAQAGLISRTLPVRLRPPLPTSEVA